MPVRREIAERDRLYFINLPAPTGRPCFIFAIDSMWFLIGLDYFKAQGYFIIGNVIMQNHIHALIGFWKPANPSTQLLPIVSALLRMSW